MLNRSNVDCLLLNETYLNISISDDELTVPNYEFFRFDRTAELSQRCGGGIGPYIHNKYDFECMKGSETCSPVIESMWLQLSLECAKGICCFYCPPDSLVKDFVETLENRISEITDDPTVGLLLLGDSNIDIHKRTNDNKLLNNLLNKTSLMQIITRPIRVSNTSSSTIDHIYI